MVGKLTPDDIITASRIPALLNASPYETPNDVLKKCIDAMEGNDRPEFKQNELMSWGDALEPVILEKASSRLRLTNTKFDYDQAFFHENITLAASLDGAGEGHQKIKTDADNNIYCIGSDEIDISGRGVLEAKNTGAHPELVPAPYRGPLQLQAQMMCVDANWGAVCVLYGGNELRVFVYQKDLAVQNRIADAIAEFEQRKLARDWYPIFSSSDGNTAYSNSDPSAPEIDLDGTEAEQALEDLVEAKRKKKIAEQQINEAEAELKEAMGSHERAVGMVGNRRYAVRWPMRTKKATPETVTPAKPATRVRQNTLTLRELG